MSAPVASAQLLQDQGKFLPYVAHSYARSTRHKTLNFGRITSIGVGDSCALIYLILPQVFSGQSSRRLNKRSLNRGVKFFGHDNFLIESVASPMMEGGGATGNSAPPRRTQQECGLFLVVLAGDVLTKFLLSTLQHFLKFFQNCLLAPLRAVNKICLGQNCSSLNECCVNNIVVFFTHVQSLKLNKPVSDIGRHIASFKINFGIRGMRP